MKPKDSSPASSRSDITPKRDFVQTCKISCLGNLGNHALARAAVAAVGAFGIFLTAGAGDTNSAPVPCALSTNAPSFFCADSGTGAVYYKYDTNGVFTVIMKEHVGVWPAYSGRWVQASNGIVTMTATTPPTIAGLRIETVVPTSYKQSVFLVWPEKEHKGDAERVCRRIDTGTNARPVANEFMISAEEFAMGTGKPNSFKFYKGINKETGTAE